MIGPEEHAEMEQLLKELVTKRQLSLDMMGSLPGWIQEALTRRANPSTTYTQIEQIRAETMAMKKLLQDLKKITPVMTQAISSLQGALRQT